jgi:catechol-2,3-dioxygenase
LDDATSIFNARVSGIHLLLPGFGDDGPTLEIFQYADMPDTDLHKINQPGFGHIAFAVENVRETLDNVVRNGGSKIGNVVSTEIKDAGMIEFVYACDPEGNIIELQKWD